MEGKKVNWWSWEGSGRAGVGDNARQIWFSGHKAPGGKGSDISIHA